MTLGLDTSNYTTSLCLVGSRGEVVSDQRIILQVASGSRGLRQSEALFQHVKNLPELTKALSMHLKGNKLVAIGVSSKPRPAAESYLPVFLPGLSLAHSLSHFLHIPCYELTHQETHIWGGLASSPRSPKFPFLTIHLSGGTTELVLVERLKNGWSLGIDLLGGTLDLHAGQFIDRLGVKLGLSFPAGPALEELANKATVFETVATFHRAGKVSFSGPLTALERMCDTHPPEVLALSSLMVLVRTLTKWIRWAETQTECRQLLMIGGVAANEIIRQKLQAALPNWKLHFAQGQYSVDNAYGAAYYAALVSGIIS